MSSNSSRAAAAGGDKQRIELETKQKPRRMLMTAAGGMEGGTCRVEEVKAPAVLSFTVAD